MSALKVVPFKLGSEISDRAPVHQHNLFGDLERSGRYYCLVDVALLNQEELLTLIAKNSVKTVVDLRRLPLFDKPIFNHRKVMDYFVENEILYIEYALAVKSPQTFASLDRSGEEPLGLSLWLFDPSTVSVGWYEHIRAELKKTRLFDAEVPVRSLKRI